MCRNDCKTKKSAHPDKVVGIWSGILLLLVPKCPFCFMAFSSVLVFCGKNGVGHTDKTFHSTSTLIITVIFCVTALLSIILYYRPVRGKYALLLAIAGIVAILFSVTTGGGTIIYYSGATLVMTGLLRNSGMWCLIRDKFTVRKNLRPKYTKITFSG